MGISESLSLNKIGGARADYIDQEGTAPFIFLNAGDIDADTDDGGNIIDFAAETKTTKYVPFDFLSINNSSSSDLNIFINQKRTWQKIVRANSIVAITDFKGIRSIRISKRGAGTITAGQVEATVSRQSLTDDEFRRRQLSKNPVKRALASFLGL